MLARFQKAPLRRIRRNLRRTRRQLGEYRCARAPVHPHLLPEGAISGTLAGADASPHGLLREHLMRDLTSRMLPVLLRYADRNSMTYSVESRVPFLDYRLVEFVLGLPPHLLYRDGWSKRLLRDAFAGRLPAEIAWRRDKIGFAPPEDSWFRWRLGERFEELLAQPRAAVFERFVDRAAIERSWKHFREAGGHTAVFWSTLNLHLWLEGYLRPSRYRIEDARSG